MAIKHVLLIRLVCQGREWVKGCPTNPVVIEFKAMLQKRVIIHQSKASKCSDLRLIKNKNLSVFTFSNASINFHNFHLLAFVN